MSRSLEYRIQRLERVFLQFAALITGEAQVTMSAEELALFQHQMAADMKEMADEL